MSISDIDGRRRLVRHTALGYLGAALFCLLFGGVYEIFSHGVWSFFMIGAFLFPLLGGFLPFLCMEKSRRAFCPPALSRNLYHAGIAALTVGSIVRGVLEIFGTTNRLAVWYWIVGVLLTLAGILSLLPAIRNDMSKD